MPILDTSLHPNDCYQYSPLLFWTILAIGSMRFESDPTLIVALGPEVIGLAKDAVFSCKDVIATVQSFTLLCAWPMPVDTLEKDPSPALAGAALQLAINSGLHVWGIGQDFSRTRLDPGGRNSADFRARLWVNCLITCQR
jgi:transcriptional regulatory protein LEU3